MVKDITHEYFEWDKIVVEKSSPPLGEKGYIKESQVTNAKPILILWFADWLQLMGQTPLGTTLHPYYRNSPYFVNFICDPIMELWRATIYSRVTLRMGWWEQVYLLSRGSGLPMGPAYLEICPGAIRRQYSLARLSCARCQDRRKIYWLHSVMYQKQPKLAPLLLARASIWRIWRDWLVV